MPAREPESATVFMPAQHGAPGPGQVRLLREKLHVVCAAAAAADATATATAVSARRRRRAMVRGYRYAGVANTATIVGQ